MSSVVDKAEGIIVDTSNEYNSDDFEEDLNLTFEDTVGEAFQERIFYSKSLQQNNNPLHEVTSSTFQPLQQKQRSKMCSVSDQKVGDGKNPPAKNILESVKRIRREIANSNERRRMQSINAGFQNLRALLPKHEGEKLSKAAILQQTSQYICDLENQKTQLLAQNSQLKRTLGQHELSFSSGNGGETNVDESCSAVKKRLGSVSPEPTTLLQTNSHPTSASGLGLAKTAHGIAYVTHTAKEVFELKKQLEKERRVRAVIEEELRLIKRHFYSDNYIAREVIENTEDNNLISYVALSDKREPSEVLMCSPIGDDDCTGTISDETIHEEIIVSQEEDVKFDTSALQPILQAAIKAQPKVEVERIDEPVMKLNSELDLQQGSQVKAGEIREGRGNLIGLTRSRQNLETIVEAIRHLEGDHLFGESGSQQKKTQKSQESPLALTNKQLASSTTHPQNQNQQQQRKTIAELSPFLQIKNPKIGATNIVTIVRGRSISLAPTTSEDLSLSVSNLVHSSPQGTTTNNMSSNINVKNGTTATTSTNESNSANIITTSSAVIPTAIVKVHQDFSAATSSLTVSPSSHITITTASLKQCRPGVIVAKQLS